VVFYTHCTSGPLDFFHYVETTVYDELIHVSGIFAEARDSIAALFRGAKLMLKDWVVLCAYYGEVV